MLVFPSAQSHQGDSVSESNKSIKVQGLSLFFHVSHLAQNNTRQDFFMIVYYVLGTRSLILKNQDTMALMSTRSKLLAILGLRLLLF